MRVDVRLLGGFEVSVDGRPVPADAWRRRNVVALVKVLALAPHARRHGEQVMDLLWPELSLDDARPRLYKAAHFARDALGQRDAVVLREDVVALFPGAEVVVDALRFDVTAEAALRATGSGPVVPMCEAALTLYGGELLPEDRYAEWTVSERARLTARHLQLLRATGRWEDLLRVEPADEVAHLELLRAAVLANDRTSALRRYETMEQILFDELGVSPSPEAVALRERVLTAEGTSATPALRNRPRVPIGASLGGLLERQPPFDELGAALNDALASGRGSVILITGEAGSGKSSLIAAFLDALAGDVDVVVGGCDDLLASRSLGPFRDMASNHPGVAAGLDAQRGDDVFDALLKVLAQPTVMVVEDVHWADDATLDVIRYLARRIGALPSLLILSVRDEAIDPAHPLRRLLGGLAGRSVRRLPLAPLSAAAVSELAARVPGAVDAEELHRVTRGNPFFVTEVLAGQGAAVPPTVRDAVLARTATLAPDARALIDRLSVVPGRAERWLARALAGDDDAVIRVERSGVLTATPTHLAFRHQLARQAVEAALTVAERIGANEAVVEALLAAPPIDPSRIVHHAERAERADLLVRYGPAAADDAIRFGAHRQAAETLRHLLDHRAEFTPVDAARMLNQLAYALYVLNEFEAALTAAEAAVDAAAGANDRSALVDALSTLSRVVYWQRGPSHAREASQRAVSLLSESADDDVRLAAALIDLARAESNLATVGVVAEPDPHAKVVAEQAVLLAERVDRDDLRSQALTYRGSARLALGDAGGLTDLADAVALSDEDPRIENRVRVRVNASGSAHRAGRPDEALRHIAAGLRLAPDVEFLAGEYRLHLTEAAIHVNAGPWDQAVAELRALVASDRGPGAMRHLAAGLLARVLARRGDDGAEPLVAAALGDPMVTGDAFVAGPLAIALVELRWLRGDTSPLPPIVATALALAEQTGHPAIHAELCAYLRRSGHPVAAPIDPPGPWAHVLAGRWAEAAAAWAELGDRYERGVVLARDGDPPARSEGVAELTALGAVATIRRLEQEAER